MINMLLDLGLLICMPYLQVFTTDEEGALQTYIVKVSKMFYGLTKLQTRELAFRYAEKKGIEMPVSWTKIKLLEKIG